MSNYCVCGFESRCYEASYFSMAAAAYFFGYFEYASRSLPDYVTDKNVMYHIMRAVCEVLVGVFGLLLYQALSQKKRRNMIPWLIFTPPVRMSINIKVFLNVALIPFLFDVSQDEFFAEWSWIFLLILHLFYMTLECCYYWAVYKHFKCLQEYETSTETKNVLLCTTDT